MPPEEYDYKDEAAAALTAALSAGDILLEGFFKDEKMEERKGKIDPVTVYDRRSEEEIVSILRESFPDDMILGEESGTSGTGNRRWIIDPLDGTVNYSHNYPVWVVSIALEVDKRMAVGVVHDPYNRETFSAVAGKGSELNKNPIKVSQRKKLVDSLLCTGFPYSNEEYRRINVANTGRLLGRCMGVRRDGSAARDLCYVACGRLDGFWELGLKPWDTAAGALIVQEAGGCVTGFHSREFNVDLGNIVASNRHIHNELSNMVNDE